MYLPVVPKVFKIDSQDKVKHSLTCAQFNIKMMVSITVIRSVL